MPAIYLKISADIEGKCLRTPKKDLLDYFNDGSLSLNIDKQDESLGGAGVRLRLNKENLVEGEIEFETNKKDLSIKMLAVFKISVRSGYLGLFQDEDVPFLFSGVEWPDNETDGEFQGLEYFDKIEKRRDRGEISVRYYIFPAEVSAKKLKL